MHLTEIRDKLQTEIGWIITDGESRGDSLSVIMTRCSHLIHSMHRMDMISGSYKNELLDKLFDWDMNDSEN